MHTILSVTTRVHSLLKIRFTGRYEIKTSNDNYNYYL